MSDDDDQSWWAKLLRPGRFVVALVILLLAVGAGYLGVRVVVLSRAATALAQQRAAVLDTARRVAIDLSSYDYHDLAGNYRTVAAESTARFADRYRAASNNLDASLTAQKAVSKGSVRGAGIESDAPNGPAVVVVLVDQSITNTAATVPVHQPSQFRLTLVPDGARWLLDAVQSL